MNKSECYEQIREIRWSEGVYCPKCQSKSINKNGGSLNQRYICKECHSHFDDLTDSIFSSHKLPIKTWILCLYFMGLNLSNSQIGQELDLHETTVQELTRKLREEIEKKTLIASLAERLSLMKFT